MNQELPAIASSAYTSSAFNLIQAAQLGAGNDQFAAAPPRIPKFVKELQQMANPTRRLVQVFIVDPDENVPLDKALLYEGKSFLTDATDQELFFEIDIKSILDKHNAFRKTLTNKAVKERTEKLEAARIRDLKMTVVIIAQF